MPSSWLPKDETLLLTVLPAQDPFASGAVWTYTRASGTAAPFGDVQSASQSPMFSPDGHWVAYSGPEGGYIQPFPATGARYQLPGTPSGPFWSPDGGRLFTEGSTEIAVVTVTTQPIVAFGNPTRLPRPFLRTTGVVAPRSLDIMPDGRFIGLIAPGQAGNTGAASAQPEIRIVLNWFEELKRVAPAR